MSEKEKGKAHPFAGHLRPAEEILWMSSEFRDSALWQMAWTAEGRAVISMIVFSVGILLMIGLATMPPAVLVAVALAVLVLSTAPVLVIWGVRRAFKVSPNTRVAHAVTTERLLYRSEQTVLDLPLEQVGHIVLHQAGRRSTLNFDPLFVEWSDIEDAASVKQIIEDARAKRLKELGR
jgi:hypothetical protein